MINFIKKNFILFLFYFLVSTISIIRIVVFAEEVSTISPTLRSERDEIKIFKEKIASKVAEIAKKDLDEIISGFVESVNDKKIFLQIEKEREKYQLKIDDLLTKFYKISNSKINEINRSDIKKNDYLIGIGLKTDNLVLDTKEIYLDEKYLIKLGQIVEVDKDKYQLKIISLDKENFLLDIETDTKQLILTPKTLNFEKIGFSKIKEGDTIHFVVKKNQLKNENNQFSAIKIIIIPQEIFVK